MSQQNSPRPHLGVTTAATPGTSGSEPSTPHTPRRSFSAMDALQMRMSSFHDNTTSSSNSPHVGNVSASCLSHIAETNAAMKEEDFELGKPIGYGSSAVVYAAVYKPTKKPVAIKMIDLDMFERNQIDELRRETALMALSKHPNVLQVYGSFVSGSKLYIVTPYLAGGSCLDIMKTAFRDGFEEATIATILRQALEGLLYLHKNGHIHRDVKAGNLLMDNHGAVLLADFGVSSSLTENNELRKTFVGTPCWMAPEVMEQAGYDYKADIWSFGITSLELATGHAPFAKYPPMKVLMMTLSNDPPTLDRDNTKHKYSKTFKEMIDMCLQKDPSKRPSAEKLLHHPFFKEAKKKEYLVRTVLSRVPPLEQRPHKKVLQRQVSVEATEQWDFDTPATTTADNKQQQQPPSGSEEKKKHITFGEVVVRNPPQPHQQQPTSTSSPTSESKTTSPEIAAPAPSKKSRFVVEDGNSKSDSDHHQSVSSLQRSTSPAYFDDNSHPSSTGSPYISPITSSTPDEVPTGLGISASSSAPPPQEVKRGRFSVNQQSTTAPGDEQEQSHDIRPLPVSRVSSQDSLQSERRSRFEVQHKPGNAPHQSSVHGPGDMHVKFDAPPMSREPSPASSSMTPTTSHKSSRFSVEKEQQQQQQQQSNKEQGVCDASTMSPECRKKGRFELTGGNTSAAVVANEKAEGYHDTPSSNVSSPTMSPCSTVSRDQSARFLDYGGGVPAVYSQMEVLLKQVDAQKSLIQEMMAGLNMSAGDGFKQRSTRGGDGKRLGGGDYEHLARSYTSISSEHYGGSVEHLQHMLAASNREREKLARENDALKREIERLRRSQSRHNSITSTNANE
ncbi:kinase family protein [Lichtheimia corymbifera JMRC:FSU:9682]|uniref:Kinase family protein n=1 Tax=Lichtheimia corymbifera JMRC:FSU:9682 TaxID=1263082 RepID=A0A068SFD2_9FUNG|nr:kinase family protein [Lichtheimia corymbifera JMRC:FSU:9682]